MKTLLCSCMMILLSMKRTRGPESLLTAHMGMMFIREFQRYVFVPFYQIPQSVVVLLDSGLSTDKVIILAKMLLAVAL